MNEEVYAITNLEGYVAGIRETAAQSLSEDNTEDLDQFITIQQAIDFVKENCVGIDEENRFLLDENSNQKIFEMVTLRIYNVGLAKLAAKDLIQCAWDDSLNEMVFWANPKKKKKSKEKNPNVPKNSRRKDKRDKGSDSGL